MFANASFSKPYKGLFGESCGNSWLDRVMKAPMGPVQVTELTAEEIAVVFAEVANKKIEYKGHGHVVGADVYSAREKLTDRMHFHYWMYDRGRMWKVGSGGYILDLHLAEEERLYEFPLKSFTRQLMNDDGDKL
jgi:hypothetical protein